MSKSRNNNCHLQTCFGVSKQAKDKGIVTLFIELMLDISIIALQMSHHSSHIVLCIINTERTQMNNLTKLDQCYSNFMFVTIRTNRLLVFLKKIMFTTIREKRHWSHESPTQCFTIISHVNFLFFVLKIYNCHHIVM